MLLVGFDYLPYYSVVVVLVLIDVVDDVELLLEVEVVEVEVVIEVDDEVVVLVEVELVILKPLNNAPLKRIKVLSEVL